MPQKLVVTADGTNMPGSSIEKIDIGVKANAHFVNKPEYIKYIDRKRNSYIYGTSKTHGSSSMILAGQSPSSGDIANNGRNTRFPTYPLDQSSGSTNSQLPPGPGGSMFISF